MGEILNSLNNVLGTPEQTRCGATNLEMILADFGSIEHRVKGGDFVNLHGGHFKNLGDLVHG